MSRRLLEKTVHAVGGSIMVDRNAEWIDVVVDAPDGQVWIASSTHSVGDMGKPGAGATDIICARVLVDVVQGVRPCDEPTCQICNDDDGGEA